MKPEDFDLMVVTCKEIFRGNIDGRLWVITQHDSLGTLKSWYWDEEKWEYVYYESVQVLKGFDSFIFKMIKLAKNHIGCPKSKGTTLSNRGNPIPFTIEDMEEEIAQTSFVDWWENKQCPQKD